MKGPISARVYSFGGGKDPPAAFEEMRIGPGDALLLGPRHRMSPDESRTLDSKTIDLEHDSRLGTANICKYRARLQARTGLLDHRRDLADRRRDEDEVRLAHRIFRRV